MATLEENIKRFLFAGYGYGYGSGDGSGDGYGDGDGYGLKTYKGRKVYMIDETPTVFNCVHGAYAHGAIIKGDLTLEPCYIARCGNCFAHGNTLKEAVRDAQSKHDESLPLEERIANFKNKYQTLDAIAEGVDLFYWHHILTGSCLFGREEFCKSHGLDPKKVQMTVREFIELTKNAYGRENIKALAKSYE